ncbi:MAG: hypothetical protein JNM19_11245 [Chitinophagaceae bacterium]|nr:hypothetical protein [Chitinophagaceae bacterium]
MARVKEGLVQVEGKVGEHVVIRKGRYGAYLRKTVAAGTKRSEPALKEQYSRTKFLNLLASDVNTVVKTHCEGLKSARFYEMVQSRFRGEPRNDRLLLLYTLRDMEVHPVHTFRRHGVGEIQCVADAKGVTVRLSVKVHPMRGPFRANCYSYEVLCATWVRKEGVAADCERQYSEWVPINKGLPEFSFYFKRPKGGVHWLCALRIRLGRNEEPVESFEADGMILWDAGAFDRAEYARAAALVNKVKRRDAPAASSNRMVKRVKASVVREKSGG